MQLQPDFVDFAAAQKQVLHEQIQGAVLAVSVPVLPRVRELVVCECRAFGQMLARLDERLVDGVFVHVFARLGVVERTEFVGDVPVRYFFPEAFAQFFEVPVARRRARVLRLCNPVGEVPLPVEPREAVRAVCEVEIPEFVEHERGGGAEAHGTGRLSQTCTSRARVRKISRAWKSSPR